MQRIKGAQIFQSPPRNANGSVTRFLSVFCATSVLGLAFETTPWAYEHFVSSFISSDAYLAGAAVRLFGGNAEVNNAILRDPVSGFSILIASGCSGLEVVILLVAGMVAFPATWPQRAAGWAAGMLAILGLNLIRIISLFYIGQYSRSMFDWAHLYVWDVLIMIDGLVIFFLWIKWLARNEHPSTIKSSK